MCRNMDLLLKYGTSVVFWAICIEQQKEPDQPEFLIRKKTCKSAPKSKGLTLEMILLAWGLRL